MVKSECGKHSRVHSVHGTVYCTTLLVTYRTARTRCAVAGHRGKLCLSAQVDPGNGLVVFCLMQLNE